MDQLQEDKSLPTLGRKGGNDNDFLSLIFQDKLAPLSSISPQSKEETYKQQGNQGVKRMGLEV